MDTDTSDRWAFRLVGPEQGNPLTDAWESFPEAPVEAFAIASDRFCAAGPSKLVFGSTVDLHEFDSSKFIEIDFKSPRQVCALPSCQFVVVTDISVYVFSQTGEIQWQYHASDVQSVHAHPKKPDFAFCDTKGKGYMVIEGEVMEMSASHLLWDDTGDVAAVITGKDILLGNQATGETNELKAEDEVIYANFINKTLFIATANDKLFVLQNDALEEVPELCPAFGDETRPFSWYFGDLSGWQKLDVAACAFSKASDLGLISSKSVIEPMNDDARAMMPFDEENFKDTSPIGAAVDWTSKAPIKHFGEDNVTAPIFWVLNNLGYLVGWSIASKDAIHEKAELPVPVKVKELKFPGGDATKEAKADSKKTKEVKADEKASQEEAFNETKNTDESQPATESKLEPKVEPKVEPKTEPKVEPKTEPKAKPRDDEKLQAVEKPVSKPESKPESEPEDATDPKESSAKTPDLKTAGPVEKPKVEAKVNKDRPEVTTEPKQDTDTKVVQAEAAKDEAKQRPDKEPEEQRKPEVSSLSPLASKWATSESTPQKSTNLFEKPDSKPAFGNNSFDSSFNVSFGQRSASRPSSRPTSGGVFDDSGPKLSFGKPKQKSDVSQSESSILADQSASFFGFASEDKKPEDTKSENDSKDFSSLSLAERMGTKPDATDASSNSEQSFEEDSEEGSNASEREFGDESDCTETDEQQEGTLSQEEYGSESDTQASDSEAHGESEETNDEQVSSDESYERIETPAAPRFAPIKPPADSPPKESKQQKEEESEDTPEKTKNPLFEKSPFADFNGKSSAFGSTLGSKGAFSSFGSGASPFGTSFNAGTTTGPNAFESFKADNSKAHTPAFGLVSETSDFTSQEPEHQSSAGSSPVIIARESTPDPQTEEPIVTEPEDDEFSEGELNEPEAHPEVEILPEFDNINSTDCQEPTDLLPFAPEEYWDLGTLDQVYAETNSFFQVIDNNIQVLGSHLQEQAEIPEGSNLMAFDQWTLAKSAELTPVLDDELANAKAKQVPSNSQLLPVIEQLDQLLSDTRQLGQSLQLENTKRSALEQMQLPYQSKQYQFQLRTKIGQCRKLLQQTEEKLMLVRVQCGERPANVDLVMACEILEHQLARTKEQYPDIFSKPWDLTSLELGIASDRFDRQRFMEAVDKSKKVKSLAKVLQERVVTATVGQ